jgi:flagellar protein FliS
MYGKGIGTYRETDVITADPKRLVIMCYEGVIVHLEIAKKRFQAGQYEAKAKAVIKAQDFLNELMHALNFDKGGEIAKNLDSLYNYMARRIICAEANRTVEPFDEVIGLLKELKEAWEQIFFGNKRRLSDVDAAAPFVAAKRAGGERTAAYGPHAR